jgi:outer membrane biogenesis lipoprotein LolB
MKFLMLLSVVATLLLPACTSFTNKNETVIETPDTATRGPTPAEGARKIPAGQ